MRLFIGIFPPKEYLDFFRDLLRKFDKEKRNLRPINLEQIHLTVRFIGPNVHDHSKQQIANELLKSAGQFPQPLIELDKIQFGFPGQYDPRVLMASVGENRELNDLTNSIHRIVRKVNRDDTILWKSHLDKNYHMSIARLKQAATRSTGRKVKTILNELDLELPQPFTATEMHLVQSEVTPQGPVYKKLERIEL